MKYLFLIATSLFVNYLTAEEQKSNRDVFSHIYESGEWAVDNNGVKDAKYEFTSGSGSSPENVKPYMTYLQDFLKKKQIKSVVDLGCGDWQFSRLIDWSGIEYTGIDVVDAVVERNSKMFKRKNISFIRSDGAEDSLPKADLLICKEVLQHLPFKDVLAIITQLSKYKYCLILNDVDPVTLTNVNSDIPRGHYRPLDLTQPPFSLKGRKVLSYASGIETKQLLLIENKYPL